MKTRLLIIDPQNDFCWPGLSNVSKVKIPNGADNYIHADILNQGKLYVPGSYDDMKRVSELISFKNYEGEFIRRRCNAAFKKYNKMNIINTDA